MIMQNKGIPMKRFLILLSLYFLFPAFTMMAQSGLGGGTAMLKAPDMKIIQKEIADKSNPRYYPKLVKRMAAADRSMTEWDFEALYFGQVYQSGYSPYRRYGQIDRIREILSQDTLLPADIETIVNLADEAIAVNPAEPIAYYYKVIALSYNANVYNGDTVELEKAYWQSVGLFQAITSTGDGSSAQSAIHVVATSHEYVIMGIWGFRSTSQSLMSVDGHSYDLFSLTPNEDGVDSLWFNIDVIVNSWSTLFGDMDDGIRDFDPKKEITSIDIPIGTCIEIEIVKVKNKNSKFRILRMEEVTDTLLAHDDKLFADPVKPGHIVGYFAPARLYEGSDYVSNCFIFKANIEGEMIQYDSEIQYRGDNDFKETSNSGIFPLVKMNEMWNDELRTLRISNIRK